MDGELTEEQKRRIEENRRKALEIRQQKAHLNGNSLLKTALAIQIPKPQLGASTSGAGVPLNDNINKNAVPLPSPQKSFLPKALTTGTCTMVTRSKFTVDMVFNAKAIAVFKTIPSRSYDTATKKWSFALADHQKLITAMKPLKETVTLGPLPTWTLATFKNASPTVKIPDVNLSCIGDKLNAALMPFQREGVCFGVSKNGRVLIADDMGLGKTIQAIAIAAYYRAEWPLLIVCPSSLRYTWAEELEQWMPSVGEENISIINTAKCEIGDSYVVIASYDMLARKSCELLNRNFGVAILDESHLLKSGKSARTKAAAAITGNCRRVILLSGTPALSRPLELFSQISFLKKGLFPNLTVFGIRYCNGKKSKFCWDFMGSSNMSELQLLLEETIMIRRLKSDVMNQLPAKQRQLVLLDPQQVCAASETLKTAASKMQNICLRGMQKRGALMQYYNETGAAKLPAVLHYIKDLVESNKKFLCFAHHCKVLDSICKTLDAAKYGYICIRGSTSSEKRKEYCDRFQLSDTCRVAVLSITAANTGLTLTTAALVVFAELFWNPGILTQAEDRAHRIGQEDCVIIQYLVAKGTADDYLWPLVQKKLDVLNKVGLSKDNFSDSATMCITNSTSARTIEDFLQDDTLMKELLSDQCLDTEEISNASKRMKT